MVNEKILEMIVGFGLIILGIITLLITKLMTPSFIFVILGVAIIIISIVKK